MRTVLDLQKFCFSTEVLYKKPLRTVLLLPKSCSLSTIVGVYLKDGGLHVRQSTRSATTMQKHGWNLTESLL